MSGDDDTPAAGDASTTVGATTRTMDDLGARVDALTCFLPPRVMTSLQARSIERLTTIQERTLRAARAARTDVVCRAPTGSGKTLAYVLPIADALWCEKESREGEDGVRAMIVTPTRELAAQVAAECERCCGTESCAVVVGGASAKVQEDAIKVKRAKIVVGTPGRLKEFVERGVIDLRTVETQVLDEIDRLLDGGFEGEIEAVMRPPGACQTLCFSATISSSLSRFLDRRLVPGYAEIVSEGLGGSNVGGRVEHFCFATKAGDDAIGMAVAQALEHYAIERVDGKVGGQAIVFTETKLTAERVRATLTNMFTTEFNSGKRARRVSTLHGDLPQPARDATLASLRSGEVDVLVATDVASRGLDLPGVELVVHADAPKSADTYSHRAGRAGRPGCAVPGVSLLLSRPESSTETARLEREAKITFRRLVHIGERSRERVTGDLNLDLVERIDRGPVEERRHDSLISDNFAAFAADIQLIGEKKKSTTKKKRK